MFSETVAVGEGRFDELGLTIGKKLYGKERTVLSWHAEADEIRPIPNPAEAALPPCQVKTNEQLFLTGLHLEQYRHATWSPTAYYEEALRRDPDDIRCLNQLGLWYLRRGRFGKAEKLLRRAVKLSQRRNPNPIDSEPIYNLALALKYQSGALGDLSFGQLGEMPQNGQTPERPEDQTTRALNNRHEAYSLFWKATWSKAQADAAYFEAAKISLSEGRLDDALDELNRCLIFGAHNQKALALKATVLRLMGCKESVVKLCKKALKSDPFNYGARYELFLVCGQQELLSELTTMLQGLAKNYDELALDYMAAGLTQEARAIWQMAESVGAVTPMTYYYQGEWEKAECCSPDYCFPNRNEDVMALETAKKENPGGARAPYYLGCLYYAARQYDLAIDNWELSAKLDPDFPTVWRNLALARFNKQDRQQEALQCMERAFDLDTTDARMLMELDQLYKRMQKPHQFRLDNLQKHPTLVSQRDDLVLEEITLLNQLGHYEQAREKLDGHLFHPWEGGEGKVTAQYQICRVETAKQRLDEGKADEAIRLLNECMHYPHHLSEGKLFGAQENDFYYFLGKAYDMKGNKEKACQCWEEAAKGQQEPAAAMYYNDAKPDKIFYQGLALLKLGRKDEANGRFYKLLNYGKQHLFDHVTMDYFAVSLPDLLIWDDSLDVKNRIHCLYLLALGYYGLGDREHARRYLCEGSNLDVNHQGIQSLLNLFEE